MKIERNMNVYNVMEMMGTEATYEEAVAMIDFLLVGDYADTDEIGSDKWLELCEMASEGVARNAELAATSAESHALLLRGANNGTEFSRALRTATNESISEEYSAGGALESLGFMDGSRLLVDTEARTASITK